LSYNNIQSKKYFKSSDNNVNLSGNANQSGNLEIISSNLNNNFQMNPALNSYYNNLKYNKNNVRSSVKNTIHEYMNKNISNDGEEMHKDV